MERTILSSRNDLKVKHMSELETASVNAGYRQLEEELSNGIPQPSTPRKLPIDTLEIVPSVFQPRVIGNRVASLRHRRSLMNKCMVESGNVLDSILIWWSGRRWLVIDGHHRLDTYLDLRAKGKGPKSIPVVVFKGALEEAHIESIQRNVKDKLPIDQGDKYTKAWHLVLLYPHYSCRKVASICKIGKSTVGEMFKKRRELISEHGDKWLEVVEGRTWAMVNRLSQEPQEFDEERLEKEQQKFAMYIHKGYPNGIGGDVVAGGLEINSERLAQHTYRELRGSYKDLEECEADNAEF